MNLDPLAGPGNVHATSLLNRLPREDVAQAAVMRALTSSRLARILREAGQFPALHAEAGGEVHGNLLTLRCQPGRIQVAIDTHALPALAMALALPKSSTAVAVVEALLCAWLDRLSPWLPGLALASTEHAASAHTTLAHHRWNGVQIGLVHCDPAVLTHLMRQSRATPADLAPWMSLRVRGRVELMVRSWSIALTRTLRPGDVVLLPGRDTEHLPRLRLTFGEGAAWHRQVCLNFQEHILSIASPDSPPRHHVDIHLDSPDVAGTDALEGLEVPVTFDLETTRLSLAEIADLQPGHTIELHAPLMEALVRIHCHGQTIGTGQLVALGDQLGVRILHMQFSDAPREEAPRQSEEPDTERLPA